MRRGAISTPIAVAALFLLSVASAIAAAAASGGGLRWPMDVPQTLSGTLGERRGNYLHSGIDIRTGAKTGHPVFAVEDGNLVSVTSRDKGYGNSILLGHGGFLSHYAHLDSFVEGDTGLNTLLRTVRMLYGGEIESYSFNNYRIRFKKGDLIGFGGETGSGPPHLHFTLREPGGPVNPLSSFSVKDDQAPVIRQIIFCVEKNGSTVRMEKIPVYLTSAGYALRENVFVAGEGERVFFKVSCFDRVSAPNRCAVFSLKLMEGDNELFAMDFGRYRWSDGPSGRFIYDHSNSVVDGDSMYTYFLCSRPGNNFSRIKALRGGFLSAGDAPRHFRVVVSDFAGNASSAEFALIKRKGEGSYFSGEDRRRVSRGAGVVLEDGEKNFRLTVRGHALFSDSLMKVTARLRHGVIDNLINTGAIRKEDSFPVYSVRPFDQVYRSKVTVAIRRPEGISPEEAGNIIIYRFFDGTSPGGLLTFYNKRTDFFEAETTANGYFTLLRDRKAPTVHMPPTYEFVTDDAAFRKLRIILADDLSGVNTKSIWLFINGDKYPFTYDYDRSWIEAKLPKAAVAKGIHHVFLRFKDRANNETIMRNLLAF